MFRDGLIIEDGLVLKNTIIIIPTSERDDLLRQIHHGHLGTVKCQLHAKETVYWPGITKDIEDIVQNCETCLKFSANNYKPKPENTLGHEVPAIPWTKLAMDIFTFDNENYLLVVDYTSKFPIICKLPYKTARVVTEIMKSIISVEGLSSYHCQWQWPMLCLRILQARNADIWHSALNNFTSLPLEQWVCWSLCQNLQGNSPKSQRCWRKSNLAMMGYCNTLLDPNQKSPVEILCGKKAHSDMSMANAALWAKGLVEGTLTSAKNQHKADVNQLIEGQTVMYKTHPEKIWRKATVVKYLRHKSYDVKSEDGGTYCCTHEHLNPYIPKHPANHKELPHSSAQQPMVARPKRSVWVPNRMDL